MCEEVLIELDYLDDLRANTRNGHLLGARHARRFAVRARSDAVELRQQARDARQRSTHLGKELDATAFRARAIIDAARPPQTATALHPPDATRHAESRAA